MTTFTDCFVHGLVAGLAEDKDQWARSTAIGDSAYELGLLLREVLLERKAPATARSLCDRFGHVWHKPMFYARPELAKTYCTRCGLETHP